MNKYEQAQRLAELLEQAELDREVKEEEMVDIPDFEGLYAITPDGRVWSYKSKRFKSLNDNGYGYLNITLCKSGKKYSKRINRLVAEVYVPKPEGWEPSWDAAHIDSNRYNNHYTNLKWQTRKENMDTNHFRECAKNRGKCPVLCVETGVVYPSQAAAARDLGVCARSISSVIRGHLNTTGGYHFKRVIKENEE